MYTIYTATAVSNYNKRNRHVFGQKKRKVVYTSTTIAWQATSKRIKRRWLTTQYDPTNVKLMSPHYPTDDKLSSWQRPTGSLVDAKWQVIFHLFHRSEQRLPKNGRRSRCYRAREMTQVSSFDCAGMDGMEKWFGRWQFFLLDVWTWLCWPGEIWSVSLDTVAKAGAKLLSVSRAVECRDFAIDGIASGVTK